MTVLLTTLLFACGPKTAPEPAAADPASFPSSQDLVSASIEAGGGAEALQSIENAIITYSVRIPAQGIEGEITIRYLAPNQMEIQQVFPNLSEGTHGFDGTHGWASDNMMGPRIMEGVELQTTERDASLTWMTRFDDFYPEAKVVEKVDADEMTLWNMEATSAWGTDDIFTFDADTGLLFMMSTQAETPMGPIPVTVTFTEYENRNGLVLPVQQQIWMASIEMKKTLLSFETNLEEFAPIVMPEDVQALLESREEPQGEAADGPEASP